MKTPVSQILIDDCKTDLVVAAKGTKAKRQKIRVSVDAHTGRVISVSF